MLRIGRIAALVLALCLLHGCAIGYYWQAVGGQLHLMRKRTPIEAAVDDPETDAVTKARLEQVAALRRFAVTELELPDNDSYTSYVDLGRDYVVWNVVAADEFSVEPLRWCFPFAGCVSYRGYFDRANAMRFERKLKERGLDTYSGGSGAYSTLGYFADPVVNTMLAGSADYVAGVLFHELAHQRLYVKGDSELSEAFATTVEEFGVEAWLVSRDDQEGLERYRRRLAHRADFADLVMRQQSRLADIYASAARVEEKRAAKAAAFAQMRAEYADLKSRWGGAGDYDGWFAGDLNNASLAAVATYRRWVPALRARLDAVGVGEFYTELDGIAELPGDQRDAWLEAWREGRSAPGAALAQTR
jgi:predicted aminopeptidase